MRYNNFRCCLFPDSSKYTLTSSPSTMHSHMYGGGGHHRAMAGMGGPGKPLVTMPGYHDPGLPPGLHMGPQHVLPPVSLNIPPSTPTPNLPPNMNPPILTPGNLR